MKTITSTMRGRLNCPLVEEAERLAVTSHAEVNHRYGEEPYAVHLTKAVEVGLRYLHLVPYGWEQEVIAALWCHDLLEDTRLTYNDLKRKTSPDVAELVYAVTNGKGRTRSERADGRYYRGIRNTELATFVKLCDRIANVEHARENGVTRMVDVYAAEQAKLERALYHPRYEQMLAHLNMLLGIGEPQRRPWMRRALWEHWMYALGVYKR
jgi:(p)ppGpp synthase/HD superfamily hydrolase